MTSTFHSIETAKRSLFTQQAALNTVGHNIANANTEGYSRQKVNMVNAIPIEAYGMNRSNTPGQLGTGVEFASITRIRNAFLDQQYRDQNDNVGSLEVQTDTLSKLEGYVAEPSDYGIRTVINKFWSAWSDLSKDTENVTGREILVEVAQTLSDSFNDLNRQLTALHSDLTTSIDVKADEINSLFNIISSLNQEITRIEALGDHANDLRDQRDLMTDKLSKIANISVMDTDAGYIINLGGIPLTAGNPVTSQMLENAFANGTLNGGEVHGFIVSRDQYVKDFADQLQTLANTIANGDIEVTIPKGSILPGTTVPLADDTKMIVKGINGLHKLGYTLEEPATAGQDFFNFTVDPNSITGFKMELNSAIANDPNKVATSLKTVTDSNNNVSTVRGNNGLALIMSELSTKKFSFDETASGGGITEATINDFYAAVIGALGVQSQEANRLYKNSITQLDQIETGRMSTSGVSLDEEMSDLIKFQYAYSASARFMTTFDQVLDKLINGTGTVGR